MSELFVAHFGEEQSRLSGLGHLRRTLGTVSRLPPHRRWAIDANSSDIVIAECETPSAQIADQPSEHEAGRMQDRRLPGTVDTKEDVEMWIEADIDMYDAWHVVDDQLLDSHGFMLGDR
jgi:hypothetical protein